MNTYNASSFDFHRHLQHAFAHPAMNSSAKLGEDHDISGEGIYHSMLGRINPHLRDNGNDFGRGVRENYEKQSSPLAFPRPTAAQKIGKKVGDGICIPVSWCQFPRLQKETKKDMSKEDTRTNEQPINQSHHGDVGIATSPITTTPSLQIQGKIKIVSQIGATIREIFDIDESNHVLGKLLFGEERYFVEKKVLPAPPIPILNDSDNENDEFSAEDECVAVVRYKIVLTSEDCHGMSDFLLDGNVVEKDSSGKVVMGWISDRGRLAEDSYLILKEV